MFSKNCEDEGMQKMYGNKVGMEETQEYNYPTSIAKKWVPSLHRERLAPSLILNFSFWILMEQEKLL